MGRIQNPVPETSIYGKESRNIQDCLGFPYMGRYPRGRGHSGFQVTGMIDWGQKSKPQKSLDQKLTYGKSHTEFPNLKNFPEIIRWYSRKKKSLQVWSVLYLQIYSAGIRGSAFSKTKTSNTKKFRNQKFQSQKHRSIIPRYQLEETLRPPPQSKTEQLGGNFSVEIVFHFYVHTLLRKSVNFLDQWLYSGIEFMFLWQDSWRVLPIQRRAMSGVWEGNGEKASWTTQDRVLYQ